MNYVSTRGSAPVLDFEGAMLTGLARDGGLYLPQTLPVMDAKALTELRNRPFADVAFAIARLFAAGSVPDRELEAMVHGAYANFAHKAVTPLTQIDAGHFLLELFHGPTIAFKDVAMQLLAPLMDWSLARAGTHATIICATSGDTGGAAIEAFRKSKRASIFVLHPHNRVSDVQRRQMTTVDEPHVHNIALEGTFDDCQAVVKALFNDHPFRDRVHLAGVNSINWVRVMAQISYYVFAGLALGAPRNAVSFTVPTGNFGNVFAGLVAKRLGLPIDRLVVATNANDIIHRALSTGSYAVKGVVATQSPSMDIEVASNFERLVYLAHGNDPDAVMFSMGELAKSGRYAIKSLALDAIRGEFDSESVDEAETGATIARILAETGVLIDPHTAVGVAAACRQKGTSPMVTLATAHPAKFPQAVEKASGKRPELPPRLGHLLTAPESITVLPNSAEAVKQHILSRPAP